MKPYHYSDTDNEISFTTEVGDNLLDVIKNCISMATMMPDTGIMLRHNYVEYSIYSNDNAQELYDKWN